MKNKRPTYSYPTKMQGFSLIEFLVASALSMIVLMAVTSTYFTARGLNSAATSRLTAQQELRQASTLIVRDARMAGGFGCFNMSNYGAAAIIKDESKAPFNLASTPGKDSLIPLSESNIQYSGFTQSPNTKALVFQYGIDTDEGNIPQKSLAIASSCTGIAKSASITDPKTARNTLHISDSDEKKGTVSLMKHVVIAYAVGSINNQSGLFRFQREDEKGTEKWGNPQLLMKDIKSMEMSYLYTENCSEDISASSPETFIRKRELQTGNTATTPALVRIQLNTADNSSHQIEASVRGGNVCADRSI